MLEAANHECVRGDRTLFSDLSFTLGAGKLLRVAGTNGSGKTSLLRILCGLLSPAHGEVRWRGGNIRSLREEYWREIVYLGHSSAIKDELTAAENLVVAWQDIAAPDSDAAHFRREMEAEFAGEWESGGARREAV